MGTRVPTVWLIGPHESKWLAFVNLVSPWTSVCSKRVLLEMLLSSLLSLVPHGSHYLILAKSCSFGELCQWKVVHKVCFCKSD